MMPMEYLLDVPDDLLKSSLRSHLAHHHKTLADEHAEMHEHFQGAHDSVDDGHEFKTHYRRLAAHHKALHEHHKAMHENLGSGDVNVGDLHGPKVRKDAIRPDGVRLVAPSNAHLVPRAGSPALEKAAVDASMEEMFAI